MPILSLSGKIIDPVYEDAFYVLRETRISKHKYRYEGEIGFGDPAAEYELRWAADGHPRPYETEFQRDYDISYYSYDMRKFQFVYDTHINIVVIETPCQHQIFLSEALVIPKNITYEFPTEDEVEVVLYNRLKRDPTHAEIRATIPKFEMCEDEYLYFQCPRSKDGVAVTRAFATILRGRPPFHIRYPLIYNI